MRRTTRICVILLAFLMITPMLSVFASYAETPSSVPYDGADDGDLNGYPVLDFQNQFASIDLELLEGAAVLMDCPTGLRFTGRIGMDMMESWSETFGKDNLTVGILITKTDYLKKYALNFTKEDLDACSAIGGTKYYRQIASSFELSENGDSYLFYGYTPDLTEDYYGTEFSAVAFVQIAGEYDFYSDYVEKDHARSVSEVSGKALADLNKTQKDEYQYPAETGFSPYTDAERAVLNTFDPIKPEQEGGFTTTVMSYNVKVYSTSNGWNGRNPSNAVASVQTANPDIVGFQEVNQTFFGGWDSYLSELTDNGYTQVKGAGNGHERLDIFYKTDKYTKLTSGTVYYKSAAKESWAPANTENADMNLDTIGTLGKGRMFSYVALQDIKTGTTLLVVNTHLHYVGTGSGYEEHDKVRRYEIKILLAWLEKQTAYSNVAVIGDMNSHYLSGQGAVNMALYTDAGFEMTCETAENKLDTWGTLVTTGFTTRQQWVFDYVLTRGDIDALSYTVVDNSYSDANPSYPADHLPVMATIRVS